MLFFLIKKKSINNNLTVSWNYYLKWWLKIWTTLARGNYEWRMWNKRWCLGRPWGRSLGSSTGNEGTSAMHYRIMKILLGGRPFSFAFLWCLIFKLLRCLRRRNSRPPLCLSSQCTDKSMKPNTRTASEDWDHQWEVNDRLITTPTKSFWT